MSFIKFIVIYPLLAFCARACQPPLRPIYNATLRQYISCNAWEPDCAPGTFCQLADKEWKGRLQINPDYTLFLCCADEKDVAKGLATTVKELHHVHSTAAQTQAWTTGAPVIVEKPTTTFPSSSTSSSSSSSSSSPSTSTSTSTSTSSTSTSSSTSSTSTTTSTSTTSTSTDSSSTSPENTSTSTTETLITANIIDNTIQEQRDDLPAIRPNRPTSFPVFAPQPQILLPGNGLKADSGPRVVQIIVGELSDESTDGTFKWSGTSTLVQDSGLNILVDTGSSQNRNKLIAALAQQGIKPQNIQIVIYTHAHPAHMGNDNVFPYAEKIYATFVFKGDEWINLQQLKEPSIRLTQNVEIWQTPGRSYLHNSVIVRNVPNQGSVAISGNVFLNERSFNHPTSWTRFAVDRDLLTQVRNMILCQSDYIIPGYGAPFIVPAARKAAAGCTSRRYMVKLARRLRAYHKL